MGSVTFLLVVVIVTALAFDFTNGFHDTANSMATSIATGALTPRVAVSVAGALNLLGAFLSTEVAKTISNGIVDDSRVSLVMIFAGLVGAILWNLLTWLVGLPSSSSHALFGGLIGAVWVGAAWLGRPRRRGRGEDRHPGGGRAGRGRRGGLAGDVPRVRDHAADIRP